MRHRIHFFMLLLFLFSQKINAQYYRFEKPPEWVKTIHIPDSSVFSKYNISSGVYLTLADYQINLKENASFSHEVRAVVSYSGITNASQLLISFDTSYQKLKIHYLYIWRKGKKTDRTSELSFELMNTENNLPQGIYTGQLSIYDILTDIRKDDLIDFAYTIEGKNPIFDNEKYFISPIEMANPIDLFSLRILYEKGKNYIYRCVGCDSLVALNDDNAYHVIEIVNRNVKAVNTEENTPAWVIQFRYFMLSSLKSWKDVNLWAQNVFAIKEETNLEAVFSEIFKGKETTDEKINKIVDYVQDEIRYMGVESGIGSIKPQSPEQVVKQRYGDCKDKSLLMVTLLKKIGVNEAYSALVSSDMEQEIDKLGPSNEIFNHCIVTFDYNGRTYWIDPTIPMQGGDFKDIYIPDYGKALVIGKTADTLQLMSIKNTETNADIVDEYTINSFTKPARLKMSSVRKGFEADLRRIMLEYYGTMNLSEIVLKDLKLQYPTVNKISEVKVNDDIEKNIISFNYDFEIDGFWQDGDKGTNEAAKGFWVFRFEPVMLYDFFKVTSCQDRKYDLILNYPVNLSYRIIFHLPRELLIGDDFYKCDNPGFYYEEKLEQLTSNSFRIDYKFRAKSNYLKAADYQKVCEQRNKIAKNLPIVIYFQK